MEQKKIHGSTHDDDHDRSLTIEHIPLDLLGEIFSRLPAKLIGRSRSVSKLWSSITTTPSFINLFAASSQPCALLIFSKRDKLFVFSSPQAESYKFTIPRDGFLQRYDSVHGLVYLETSTQLMIWNPTMKHFFTLPEPEESEGKYITGSLGYDPIECKYKALCHLTGDKIGILTLGSQESWRILSQGFPSHYRRMTDCVICINGVIYYQCFSGLSLAHAIMSFDLKSEKFHLIKYPSRDGCFFVSYEGRLALMLSSNGRSGIELWILVNAENHEWVYKHFPTPYLGQAFWVLRDMKLKGVTAAGEFIYFYSPFSNYSCRKDLVHLGSEGWSGFKVIYFDPKKNSSREVNFPGIAFDDLKRLRVLGSDLIEGLTVVPNHIESLTSL
ncbi:F-box domain-containing protein [Hirschfeldia incana]|nr:F-box domain-containing protein [Hirschfeldia incana]